MIFNKHKNKVDIILQPKLGDAILSLPAIFCLKQLNDRYNKELNINIISTFPKLTGIIKNFNIFNSKQMNLFEKAKSWFYPADKAFFLMTTSKNLGYYAKSTYGISNPHKKLLKYTNEATYLSIADVENEIDPELFNFLKEKFGFSTKTLSAFGVCYDLGFTTEQIIETFSFNADILKYKSEFIGSKLKFKENSYVVFCMEAANNNPVDLSRRWDEQNYLKIAEKLYQDHGLKVVFIGVNKRFKIPPKSYITDLRKKLDLVQLARLLRFSKGYIGNDTGPLHLCNLVQKPSIGVYFLEPSTRNFTPVFPSLNRIVLQPKNVEEVFSNINFLVN